MSIIAQRSTAGLRQQRRSCLLICAHFCLSIQSLATTSSLALSPRLLVRRQARLCSPSPSNTYRAHRHSNTRKYHCMSPSPQHHAAKKTETCRHDSPFLDTSNVKTVLIILNSPIPKPPCRVFHHLWECSSFRVCADGGANRLFDAISISTTNNMMFPNAICGDLDSLRPDVRAYYETKGVSIQQDDNQDTNDLDKALQLVHSKRLEILSTAQEQQQQCRVCVYGAFGGRFDQEMACIQALFKWSEVFDNKLFLLDDNTCAFLLPAVIHNEIRLPFYGEEPSNDTSIGEGPTCGLIPIGHRCEFVHTTGLKWNLDGSSLEFGGMVSTSNRVMEQVVTVQASHPLVFTAEMSSGTSSNAER